MNPLKLIGRFKLDIYEHEGGPLIHTMEGFNLITTVGKAFLAGIFSGATTWATKYIAIGTGTNAANVADTTLQTEITTSGGARALATSDRTTTAVTNDTLRVVVTFTFTGSFAITESGLLDASSAGNLVARRVFSAVNVVNGNVGVATWTVQLS